MHSMWTFVLLAATTVVLCSAFEGYEVRGNAAEQNDDLLIPIVFQDGSLEHAAILIPRRLVLAQEEEPLESIQSRILKRRALPEEGFTKRATSSSDRLAAIPRSGLMISGRGWMPGFVDQPRVFKRSVPLHKILVRPVNIPIA